jgi:hypothetical protein
MRAGGGQRVADGRTAEQFAAPRRKPAAQFAFTLARSTEQQPYPGAPSRPGPSARDTAGRPPGDERFEMYTT